MFLYSFTILQQLFCLMYFMINALFSSPANSYWIIFTDHLLKILGEIVTYHNVCHLCYSIVAYFLIIKRCILLRTEFIVSDHHHEMLNIEFLVWKLLRWNLALHNQSHWSNGFCNKNSHHVYWVATEIQAQWAILHTTLCVIFGKNYTR